MAKKNKVLVVAAHPDDELLGVAGTLCRHKEKGDDLSILILANGEDSRDSGADAKKRLAQAGEAAKDLGATLYLENLPDNQFDSVPLLKIAKLVEVVVAEVKPDTVYTHYAHDLNIDHRLTCQAVLTACRPMPGCSVKTIFSFETLSATEWQIKDSRQFSPNYYVDITKNLEEKKRLLKYYNDEMRSYPHPRSYEGIDILAKYRGLEVGLKAAEAFVVVRAIFDG
jgi:LmbE family N-acetylglucosaminyl deacetylase